VTSTPTRTIASLDDRMKSVKRSALIAGGVFVAVIAIWGLAAPLSSATVATGIVSPDSGRKTVQHLEGGIVERILVAEGDQVSEGQPIAILVDAKTRSTRESQLRRRYELLAQLARLEALANNGNEPDFATLEPSIMADSGLAAFVANEAAAFRSRRSAFDSKIEALQNEIRSLQHVVATADQQLTSLREELDLVHDELATKQGLLDKGLTTRPVMQALDRRRTQIDAQLAQMTGQFKAQRSTIAQKSELLKAEIAAFRNEVADQAAKAASELAAVEHQLTTSNDAIRRMEVRAPEAGTVVSLKMRTPGGVVTPGAAIADLVPLNGGVVLEVRIKPSDISRVVPGQTAQVALTAYSQREVPYLDAAVKTVSADAITDPATREIYYKAELRIAPEVTAKLSPAISLVAGMPVEAYINHHKRTLVAWLYEPIARSFYRGTREY
jgi:HlyD family type I secretion membrane fusion protein